jgi:hypothetical protein
LKYVELIETSTFTRQITALLSDEDYGAFQSGWQRIQVSALSSEWRRNSQDSRGGWIARHARGGARVIYYWAVRKDLLLLLYAYPKNVSADLTPKQVAQLAKVVKEEFRDETGNV